MDRMMTKGDLVRTPGVSLHRHVYMVLKDKIMSGTLVPATMLKEEELCKYFDVSRITVRRAMSDLSAEKLIERRQGVGTFVCKPPLSRRRIKDLSFVDSLRESARDTEVEVLEGQDLVPPPEIRELLGLANEDVAFHAVRKRSMKKVPVMLTDAWIPSQGDPITVEELKKRALYQALCRRGVEFGRVIQQFGACVADPERAGYLDVSVGSPLLTLTRIIHDKSEKPVLWMMAHLPPERSTMLMEIAGENINTLNAGVVDYYL